MHISKFWLWLQKAHLLSETVFENNYLLRDFDILRRSAFNVHDVAVYCYSNLRYGTEQ